MAMKDIKSTTVEPGTEDEETRLWMSFGWELKNSQEVKTQDVQKFTGQDSDGTKHYQTTRGEHYIKLTFERDPERKNYAELKTLEAQYYAPLPTLTAKAPIKPGRFGCLFSILIGIIFFLGIVLMIATFQAAGSQDSTSALIVGCMLVVVLLLGVLIIVKRNKSYPKRLKPWEEASAAYQTQHSAEEQALAEAKKRHVDALEKAKSLV